MIVRAALNIVFRRSEIREAGAIAVWLRRRAPRVLDLHDGLPMSLKAVVDGIADALEIDDADPRVAWSYGQEKDSEYGVDVMIEIEKKGGEA